MVARRVLIGTALVALAAVWLAVPRSPAPRSSAAVAAPATPTPVSLEQQAAQFNRRDPRRMDLADIDTAAPQEGGSAPGPVAFQPPPAGQPIAAEESNPVGRAPAALATSLPAPGSMPNGGGVNAGRSNESRSEAGSALLDTLSELQGDQAPGTEPTAIPFEQRIYGARQVGPTATPLPVTPNPAATLTPTVTPTPGMGPVGGQPTGYMMLQLMEPAARASVERQLQILLDSKVMTLYLGALVDGTFDQDYPYLENVVRRLNTGGRTLTLALFFSNGSAQRRNKTAFDGGIFNNYEPVEFRRLIQIDPELQQAFRAEVAKAIPVFTLNTSLNPANRNYAFPMLEDNLDNNSYAAMRRILRAALNDTAEAMRNPCPGCSEDKQSNKEPLGSGLESHNPADITSLRSIDGFTFDGTGFAFPGEAFGLPLEEVKLLKEQAVTQGIRYIGLWRAQRQGLGPGTTTDTPPAERRYEIPSEEQAQLEIELLRWGLPELKR